MRFREASFLSTSCSSHLPFSVKQITRSSVCVIILPSWRLTEIRFSWIYPILFSRSKMFCDPSQTRCWNKSCNTISRGKIYTEKGEGKKGNAMFFLYEFCYFINNFRNAFWKLMKINEILFLLVRENCVWKFIKVIIKLNTVIKWVQKLFELF